MFKIPGSRLLGPLPTEVIHRIPDRIATTAFDLFEMIRTLQPVPGFGDARRAILDTRSLISQHPRYLGYWYDHKAHSMVGMHLGVDLIRNQGKFHIVEFNLNAALRPERRKLYNPRFDPIISGIIDAAKSHGFKRVVPFVHAWPEGYVQEFITAGEESGVEVIPVGLPNSQTNGASPVIGLPEKLLPDTMYIIFSARHAAVEYYIHDKLSSSIWLRDVMGEMESSNRMVAYVPTSERLTVPPLNPESPWPNLVVKLSDSDRGKHVLIGKFKDAEEAKSLLGINTPEAIPKAFRLGWFMKVQNLLLGRGRVLYQPFIPPELDENGHATKLRLHLLVSPIVNRFLSVHSSISKQKVPDQFPFGIMKDQGSLVVTLSQKASLALVDQNVEADVRIAAGEIGKIIHQGMVRKFIIN